jgi:hypothetical protein
VAAQNATPVVADGQPQNWFEVGVIAVKLVAFVTVVEIAGPL